MTQDQENDRSRFAALQTYLNGTIATWSSLPAFVTQKTIFDSRLVEFDVLGAKQAEDITGVTDDKEVKLLSMIAMAIEVGGGAEAYAKSINNNELYEKVHIVKTDFTKADDTEAANIGDAHYNNVNAEIGQLLDFGVTPPKMTTYRGFIDTYKDYMARPRTEISIKAATTEMIPIKITEIKGGINIMVGLVNTYSSSNPDFVAGFSHANETVDLGGGGPKKPAGG